MKLYNFSNLLLFVILDNVKKKLKTTNFQKIISLLKNASWIFFDRIFRVATSLFVSVWIARYLGPEKFGILNYVYVFPLMFSALASIGLTNILYNEFITQKDNAVLKKLFTTSLLMKLVAGSFALILVIITNNLISIDRALSLLITISAISLVTQSLDIADTYFQSQRKVQYSIIPKLIVFFIATGFRIMGLWGKYSILFFVLVTSGEIIISSIISFFIFKKYTNLRFNDFQLNLSLATDLLKRSWPLMITELCLFLYTRVDLLMIKHLSTNTELGNYSVAMRITDLWYFIPMALTASLYPSIIVLRESNYQEYLDRYRRMLSAFALVSISIALFLTLAADPIIHLLYGNKYRDVGTILSVNVWTGLFVFLSIGCSNWFIVESMQYFVLRSTIVGAIINILLNWLLIPTYNALGASIATLIAQLCATFLINGLYSRTKEVFMLQTNAILFLPKFVIELVRRVF